jgi:hypothetical protein
MVVPTLYDRGAMMAHFFQPTQPDRARVDVAASGAALSELFIRPGTAVRIGLWGGHSGEPHDLQVFRHGIEASGFPSAPVKLVRTLEDIGKNIQVYTVTGLWHEDKLIGVRYQDRRPGTDELPVVEFGDTPSALMREATSCGLLMPKAISNQELRTENRRAARMAKPGAGTDGEARAALRNLTRKASVTDGKNRRNAMTW